MRFTVSGSLDSISAIEALLISDPQSGRVMRLGDIARIYPAWYHPLPLFRTMANKLFTWEYLPSLAPMWWPLVRPLAGGYLN